MRLRKAHTHEDNDEGFGGGDAQVLHVLADAMTYFVTRSRSRAATFFGHAFTGISGALKPGGNIRRLRRPGCRQKHPMCRRRRA